MIASLLLACSSVTLRDDTQLNLDLEDVPVSLASPYLVGAHFDLRLVGNVSDLEDYSLQADTPGIFTIGKPTFEDGNETDDEDRLVFPTIADQPGSTILRVFNADGEEILEGEARVEVPTRFDLYASTDIEVEVDPQPVHIPNVYTGGRASFRIDFSADGQPLAGAGGVTAQVRGESDAIPDDSTFPDDENWLTLAPTYGGEQVVVVKTGGIEVGEFSFLSVNDTGVENVQALRDSEDDADEGDPLSVTVWGEDPAGARVYGIPFRWQQDGQPFAESGDQYIYTFDSDVETDVLVQGGGRTLSMSVHGVGNIADSNDVACAVANVGPIGSAMVLALLGIARRRRFTA